jgi:hypothetical protein
MLGLVVRSLIERHASSALQPRNLRYEPISSKPVNHVALALVICAFLVYVVVGTLVYVYPSLATCRSLTKLQIAYTILDVVGTLVMVEEVPPPADLADEADEPLLDPALPVPRWRISTASGTVTSGVRKTIRYLRAEAGRFAMFRGFGYFLAYSFFEGLINGIVTYSLRPLLSFAVDIVVPIFTPVMLWRFNNAWLHKVISKPSQKNWNNRVREQKSSLTVKRAILLWAFCRSIASFIPAALLYLWVLRRFEMVNGDVRFDGSVSQTVLESLGIFALNLVLLLLLVVPATVILVRIQASVLPANDEVIVLLDKALCKSVALESTDGNTVSETTAGRYELSLLGAWRSFAWPARISLLKVYAKYCAIVIALTVVYTVVLIVICLAFKFP